MTAGCTDAGHYRRTRSMLTALAAGMLTASASAAEFIVIEDACRGRQLLISGPIEAGDAERFGSRLAGLVNDPALPAVQDPETLWTIKLDSPGGDVEEAMRIGRLVRAAVATTETSYRFVQRPDGVWDFQSLDATICLDAGGTANECFADIAKAECAGACLLIWLAGAERYAHEGRLGVHGLPHESSSVVSIRAYLDELEVPSGHVAEWLNSGWSGARWLEWPTRQALSGRSARLESRLEGCPRALSSTESLDSVMHTDPGIRDRLMDRAEAHRACRLVVVTELRGDLPQRLLRVPSEIAVHAHAP